MRGLIKTLCLLFFAFLVLNAAGAASKITIDSPTATEPVAKKAGDAVAVQFKYTGLDYPNCPASYTIGISSQSFGEACSLTVLGDSWIMGYGYYGPTYACGFENNSEKAVRKECMLKSDAAMGYYDISVEITDNKGNTAGTAVEKNAVRIGKIPELKIETVKCNGYVSNQGICNDSKIIVGDLVAIELEILNIGTEDAENVEILIYNFVQAFSQEDKVLAKEPIVIPVIKAGERATILFEVKTENITGEIRYLITIDPDNKIPEVSKENNIKEVIVIVKEKCVENSTRECGSGVGACQKGIETCIDGKFQNCTAAMPSEEICSNETDDDCDGITDIDCMQDTDGDGLTDEEEKKIGTDPASADTDFDNVTDFQEVKDNTNPLDAKDNLLEIKYKKELMAGEEQEISVVHPVTGILKGITVEDGPNEHPAADDGFVRYAVNTPGKHEAAVAKNNFSGEIEYLVVSPIIPGIGIEESEALRENIDNFFGRGASEQPALLLVFLLLCLTASALAYDDSKFLYSEGEGIEKRQPARKLLRALIAALFFAAPLGVNRLIGFNAGIGIALIEIAVLVYIELNPVAHPKIKAIPGI